MNKSFYAIACLAVSSLVICEDPHKRPDISDLVHGAPVSDQVTKFTSEMVIYQNILKAGQAAAESKPFKKSLNNFTASFNTLVQAYAKELAGKLDADGKKCLVDITSDMQDLLVFIKNEAALLNDLDQATREQREAELNAKCMDRLQQIGSKLLPLAFALQEQQPPSEEEINKNAEALLTQLIFNVGQVTDALKK